MSNLSIPFNIELLQLTDRDLTGLKPVRVLDVFDGATKNFHEDGLFSPSIFGSMGDLRRSRRYSFIDVKLPVFHPVVFNTLSDLKRLYVEIISGKGFARWDTEVKDFVKSDQLDGETGFQFFMEHWQDIQFDDRGSDTRATNIKLIQKYQKLGTILNTRIVVMPAGLRDYEISSTGQESENEFNDLYRKLLAVSASIPSNAGKDIAKFNAPRYSVQFVFNQIYALFQSMTEGKKKLVNGKWAARGIMNGTRNVISSADIPCSELGAPNNIGINDTVVGLYQYLKATLPVSKHQIKSGFLSKVFSGPNTPAFLVNKKTLKKEAVTLKGTFYDTWMTEEGLDKVIALYAEGHTRHKQLELAGYYVGLIYKAPGVFRLFQDIDELPESHDKSLVTPITFTELLYTSVYPFHRRYPAFVTRYPITGFGSIYPSHIYLRTTMGMEVRKELGEDWSTDNSKPIAYSFPTNTPFFNSMSPSAVYLKGLGGDFDGDTCSLNVLYAEESIAEVDAYLGMRRAYVNTSGVISASSETDTIQYLLRNMTGNPQ